MSSRGFRQQWSLFRSGCTGVYLDAEVIGKAYLYCGANQIFPALIEAFCRVCEYSSAFNTKRKCLGMSKRPTGQKY